MSITVRFVILMAALIILQGRGLDAQTGDWGEPLDGLQMAVAVVRQNGIDPQIRITVRGVGDKAVLLPLGLESGGMVFIKRLRVFVVTPQGKTSYDLNTRNISIKGRVEPVAIPMLEYTNYTFQVPVKKWLAATQQQEESDDNRQLQPYHEGVVLRLALQRAGKLWSEWDATPMKWGLPRKGISQSWSCPPIGTSGEIPNPIRCWEKTLVSNTLTLPR